MMPDSVALVRGALREAAPRRDRLPQVNYRAINHNKFDALVRVSVRQGPDWVLIAHAQGGCRWWRLGWPGVQVASESPVRAQ